MNWPADKVERRRVSDLTPYARNARTHSDEQVAQIAASIKEWGWTVPVLIDESGEIIAGHGRVLAAQRLGLKDVPCMVAEGWSEAQRRAYVIADNKLTINGGWNDELLRVELQDLQELGFDAALTGFSMDELASLVGEGNEGLTDPDEIPEVPASPITQPGDVWVMGRHRLVCGDSSDDSVVAKALDGAQPDCVVYDPPYDVESAWGWLYPAASALVFFDYKRMLEASKALAGYSHVYLFVWDGVTSWYTPNRPLARHKACAVGLSDPYWDFEEATYRDGKEREAKVVTNTRGTSDYKPLSGGRVHLQTVYQHPNTKTDGAHAHAKPVEWVRALLKGARARVILDQFAGSGTTIIAATEAMTVAAIELDPAMCDVIVERWESASGSQAARVSDG